MIVVSKLSLAYRWTRLKLNNRETIKNISIGNSYSLIRRILEFHRIFLHVLSFCYMFLYFSIVSNDNVPAFLLTIEGSELDRKFREAVGIHVHQMSMKFPISFYEIRNV